MRFLYCLFQIQSQTIPAYVEREALRPLVEDVVLRTLEDMRQDVGGRSKRTSSLESKIAMYIICLFVCLRHMT